MTVYRVTGMSCAACAARVEAAVAGVAAFSQVDCIITLTATKLHHNRIVIPEEITTPIALQRMVTVKHL